MRKLSLLKYRPLCQVDQLRVTTDLGHVGGIDDMITGVRVSEADDQRAGGSLDVLHDIAKRCRNLDISG